MSQAISAGRLERRVSFFVGDMKICIYCQTAKPLDDFCLYKRSKDGRTATCKQCRNKKETKKRDVEKERERYHANKERHKNKRREYYQNNALETNDRVKQWRKDNPERLIQLKFNYVKKKVSMAKDGYIKGLLTKGTSLTTKDIPDSLVECKRLELKIKRELREMK